MSQVSHKGVTLHYIEVGDKENPPLIFLHGILAFTESYSEFIERLAEKYFVVGIDMRGHGRSTIGTDPYSHKLVADDVILVADKIGLDKFYVVGHSAGGFALLSIAKLYSDRLIKGVSIASLYNHEGIDYNEKNDDYLTRKGFMDNRNNRNNYTLKIFDRAYEKIGEHENRVFGILFLKVNELELACARCSASNRHEESLWVKSEVLTVTIGCCAELAKKRLFGGFPRESDGDRYSLNCPPVFWPCPAYQKCAGVM